MKPSILLTLESMRHKNTGLYTFGLALGRELLRQGRGQVDLSAYTYPTEKGVLGDDAGYVQRRIFHRLFFPARARFDLVHFADQHSRLMPASVKGKTVLTVHDLNWVYEEAPGSRKLRKHMRRMRQRIAHVDHVVAISNYVAADVVRHFPEAIGRITVIHNGCDYAMPPAGHVPAYAPPGPFLFALGMVCAKKNFHVLMPLLQDNALTLVVAGIVKEDYRARIETEARQRGVADRVKITGPVSETDKDWYYAHCEAFLFPSLAEGFGLPVIEAMHHGKPVFASTLTSLPEVGGEAAYYFDNFEAEHMRRVFAEGMAHFQASDGAARVRRHAAQFTWTRAAADYLALFRRLLA